MRWRVSTGLAPLAIAVLVPWIAPRVARACSCLMPPPPAEALAEADAVFEARPFGMHADARDAHYRFEVDRVWKGEIGTRVEVSTSLHSASCGREYAIGTRYLVYARRSRDGTGWTDGLCSRTRTSQAAAEDFEELGVGRDPQDTPASPGVDPDSAPTEPPRIEPVGPQPPPTSPSRRGCAVEKPHTGPASWAGAIGPLALLLLAARRRHDRPR